MYTACQPFILIYTTNIIVLIIRFVLKYEEKAGCIEWCGH